MLYALVPVERELLIFAAFWFAVGLFDEAAIDCHWFWLRLTGRIRTRRLPIASVAEPLRGPAAILIPAFQESQVIAVTIRHILKTWSHQELRLYVGCYRNDAATVAAAIAGAGDDPRIRLVIHGTDGPTTKADCLNRLYRALSADELRFGIPFRAVILHDSEDMVHPDALTAIDVALAAHDFVQLPVRPALQAQSRWIAGHYADEFAESHTKTMVVRSALGAAIPAAGVGCGFSRQALAELAEQRRRLDESGPFATDCLTEDYELGLLLSRRGRGSTFLRLRDHDGALVATASFFPADLGAAVRQKTRWVHGIAYQAWDRMGWSARPVELWMALRDRRGPLTALVLLAAYLLLVIEAVFFVAAQFGWQRSLPVTGMLGVLVTLSIIGFVWRVILRAAFTTREYGLAEGLRSILRAVIGNIIAIMAARRASAAYLRTLMGGELRWDKTVHLIHPATVAAAATGRTRRRRARA